MIETSGSFLNQRILDQVLADMNEKFAVTRKEYLVELKEAQCKLVVQAKCQRLLELKKNKDDELEVQAKCQRLLDLKKNKEDELVVQALLPEAAGA